jgi:hypothetical protein
MRDRFFARTLLAMQALAVGCTSADFGTEQDKEDTGAPTDDGVLDTSRADVVGIDVRGVDGIVPDGVPTDGPVPDSLPPVDAPPACPTGERFLRSNYPVGNNPSAIVAGDVDGSGTIDLVVANGGGGTINVLLGKGDGTFAIQPPQAIGAVPTDLVLADFNGDKVVDIAGTALAGNAVGILLGTGAGKFATVVSITVSANPTALLAMKLNADDRMDLVVTSGGANVVETMINTGATPLAFDSKTAGTGISPVDVAPIDIDKDTVMDLAVVNGGGDSLTLLFMKSDGSVGSLAPVYGLTAPRRIATGDFNTDGRIDLAVTNESSPSVAVLAATGTSTYAAPKNYPVSLSKPAGIVATDLDRDGHIDIVAGSNEAIALLDVGSLSPSTLKVSIPGAALATADFNGDDKPDLAATNGAGNAISVLLACH